MAITGLLIHTQPGRAADTATRLEGFEDLTIYGIHEDEYVIVVSELASKDLEASEKRIKALEYVLTVYTTYMSMEDEMAPEVGKDGAGGDPS